jgi:hypothetical protein
MVAIGWLGCVAKTLGLCGLADAIWHWIKTIPKEILMELKLNPSQFKFNLNSNLSYK